MQFTSIDYRGAKRVTASVAVTDEDKIAEPVAVTVGSAEPEPQLEPEFIFMAPRATPPAPAPVEAAPFVELIPLGPDVEAVDKVLPKLTNDYPHILPRLLALEESVVEAARESSLFLAGQRTGAWVFERDFAIDAGFALGEAIERIGVPALRALVEVERQGEQLHIRNSPQWMAVIPAASFSAVIWTGCLAGSSRRTAFRYSPSVAAVMVPTSVYWPSPIERLAGAPCSLLCDSGSDIKECDACTGVIAGSYRLVSGHVI